MRRLCPQPATASQDTPSGAMATMHGANAETRLSILTAWVIAADAENMSYSLTLPQERISTGKGPEHRARCLEKLALYPA